MTRPLTRWLLAASACLGTVVAAPAAAQVVADVRVRPVAQVASAPQADLRGVVQDEAGQPLAGAVVSVLGSTTAFAVSDRQGRFSFRLPSGPYLLRAHLQEYVPGRGRIVHVDPSATGVSTISLVRRADADQPPAVLAAGVGPADVDSGGEAEPDTHDHGEVAWRLRHLKRSVLKDLATGLMDIPEDDSFLDSPLSELGRAVGTSTRFATALFSDLPLSGQFNLLTSTSFDRPQDLFSPDAWMPRGIAFVSIQAPTAEGEWTMRGAITQGDLASWIVAGSHVRQAPAAHRYEAGLSYGTQRYLGGNADALAAVSDGGRNVGAMYAYDNWAINPVVSLNYGAKYARYDYLLQQSLLSPRASVTVTPTRDATFTLRATASRRAVAPGAEEFIPPSTGLWLPPERTFSPVSSRSGFTPERIDHVEFAAEREFFGEALIGVRVFRQQVDDQLVTLFGVAPPGTAAASLGHYYVGSAGDLDARGWGMSVSRSVSDGVRASVDYTRIDSSWTRSSRDALALSQVAASVLRDQEAIHDLTTSVESVVPVTDTRVFVIYKINAGFADARSRGAGTGARFDVQLTQSLPFAFASAQWEMLVAVRNMFREELLDASVYDELLVLRPPKRVVGGVTVRF